MQSPDSIPRQEQIIQTVISLIAEHGYAYTSLQRIADAASISKATVLYHFSNKNELVSAAYDTVLADLTGSVGKAVAAASSPADAVEAYVTSMVGYFATSPERARFLVRWLEVSDSGVGVSRNSAGRWGPLAELITQAQKSGQYSPSIDPRAHAVALGGVVDALINESHADPTFALDACTATLLFFTRSTADGRALDTDAPRPSP